MNQLVTKPLLTPEDLLAMPDGDRYELVDGHLVERTMSLRSSAVGGILVTLLTVHCRANRLGVVLLGDAGFQCFPDAPKKVRKPDVSFLARERLAQQDLDAGYSRIPPDMAAEVISPNDLFEDVDRKVEEYLRVGVRLVWIVSPATRQVYVHRPDGSVVKLRENAELTGEEVIPGFRCPIAELFRIDEPPQPPAAS
jgi:Uma2 family endonuclease